MKNFTTKLIASAMLASCPALASAWGTLDSPETVYSLDNEVACLKTARTSDGKTYVSWLQWSEQQGWGYDLHLQLLDEDGKPMWDEESLAVETQRNASWTADYSLVAAPNGDAILSWADARSEEDAEYAQGHEPVLYRVNQKQEYVWSDDGITFGPEYMFPPTLYMIGEDLYAILISSSDYGPSKITRINADGTLAFTPKEFAGHLAPSEGTDFISVDSGSKGTVAMRYNRDVEPVWDEPAVVSEYLYSGYSRDPYRICPDGQGGVAVTFARALDFSHLPVVNHISADGEATFGPSVDVIPEDNMVGDYDYPVIGVNSDTETILTIWNQSGAGKGVIGAQQFDYFGERLFGDDGIAFAEKKDASGYSFGPIALYPMNDEQWFVCYADEQWWAHSVLHFACYDNNGSNAWDYEAPEATSITDPSFSYDDGVFTFTCINEETDDDWNTVYKIQTIQFSPATVGVDMTTVSNVDGNKEYFSINGTRLDRPAKGINIVRCEDGSTRKVLVK